MKKLAVLLLVFVVPGCICCGGRDGMDYSVGDALSQDDVTSTASASTTSPIQDEESLSELRDYVDTGDPYYCTFVDRKTLSQTWRYQLWAKDWKYHAIVDVGKGRKVNLVYDQAFQYVWDEGRRQGMKYPVSSMLKMTGHVDKEIQDSGREVWYLIDHINPDTIEDLSCRREEVSDSRFTPPSYVKFETGRSVVDTRDDD